MPITLFLSAYPGDAVFAVGALMASLPANTTYHATVFPSNSQRRDAKRSSDRQDFAQQALALTTLGVQELAGSLVEGASDSNGVTDQVLHDRLAAYVTDLQPDAIVLPLGLTQRPGDLQLTSIVLRLRQEFSRCRWLQYFDQPFVAQHRGQFPELAFARRVRGLAEVDDDASMFTWSAGTSSLNSASGADPLSQKLTAAGLLEEIVIRRFVPANADDATIDYPRNTVERTAFLRRSLGQREWLRTLHG